MKMVSVPGGMSEDVVNDTHAGEAVAFKIPKGQSLPVKMSVNRPFMALENETNNVVFSQDMFLTMNAAGLRVTARAGAIPFRNASVLFREE
ncbi:hypothetical protein [Chitinolyticbacter albus]|uniref:hypothetical protein n=1 Tax=Chitinolyticbacter albus TaxID=2961951 RepID=UPI00210BF1A5|nr:hypothetical protein [Chitinolyticbacter albus]